MPKDEHLTAADRKARSLLDNELKAIAFDDALEVARRAPDTARKLAAAEAELKARKAADARPISVTVTQPKAKAKAPREPELRGTRLIAATVAVAMAKHLNHGAKPDDVLERLLPGDGHAWNRRKAATLVAGTAQSEWGLSLTATELKGFYSAMQDVSVFAQLAARGQMIPFGSANAITIPRRPKSDEGSLTPDWVQEHATIPVKQGMLGAATMNRFKKAIITVASNELIKVSNPAILSLLETFIIDDLAAGLDADLLNPAIAAIPQVRPASITNGRTTAASAGDTMANIVSDWKQLRAWASAGRYRAPVVLMHTDRRTGLEMVTDTSGDTFPFRDEVRGGSLFNLPILDSVYAPSDLAVVVDASVFVSAGDLPEVDTSSAVTLAMADSDGVAPSMDGTVDGSINISDAAGTVPPTEVRSMMQTYSTALRVVTPISYGLIADNCAYLSGVSW
ncbi:phage major capsid protein [Primorskyibacter sp. S87]|uniref:phage major capsid protein n=1 Tax=Primorskyibacter sp. S87 TaxID=3415126 RepID=UPI003C798CF4